MSVEHKKVTERILHLLSVKKEAGALLFSDSYDKIFLTTLHCFVFFSLPLLNLLCLFFDHLNHQSLRAQISSSSSMNFIILSFSRGVSLA